MIEMEIFKKIPPSLWFTVVAGVLVVISAILQQRESQKKDNDAEAKHIELKKNNDTLILQNHDLKKQIKTQKHEIDRHFKDNAALLKQNIQLNEDLSSIVHNNMDETIRQNWNNYYRDMRDLFLVMRTNFPEGTLRDEWVNAFYNQPKDYRKKIIKEIYKLASNIAANPEVRKQQEYWKSWNRFRHFLNESEMIYYDEDRCYGQLPFAGTKEDIPELKKKYFNRMQKYNHKFRHRYFKFIKNGPQEIEE